MSDNVSDIMPSGRSKRAAATAAESLISKVVDVEKDFERYSRSKKSKYDFDGDYFDDGDDAWSVDSDSNCPRWYRYVYFQILALFGFLILLLFELIFVFL